MSVRLYWGRGPNPNYGREDAQEQVKVLWRQKITSDGPDFMSRITANVSIFKSDAQMGFTAKRLLKTERGTTSSSKT